MRKPKRKFVYLVMGNDSNFYWVHRIEKDLFHILKKEGLRIQHQVTYYETEKEARLRVSSLISEFEAIIKLAKKGIKK